MLKSLIGIRLSSLLVGSLGTKKDGKFSIGRAIGIGALVLFLLLCFGFFFVSMGFSLGLFLVPYGYDAAYFAIFNIIAFALIFILSIFETKSELFDCKDNELLLSMPIKPGYIVISRVLTVLLLNVGEALIVMVPAVIVYAVLGGNPWFIPSALIISVIIAGLATALSSAVGYLVAIISKKFRNNSLITVLASVAFLALYFVGYTYLIGAITSLEELPEDAIATIGDIFAPIEIFGEISILSPLPTVIFILGSVVVMWLAWYIISKSYIKIITGTVTGRAKKYVRRELRSGSAFVAIAKKELLAFFSSATYILNGVAGSVFQIIISIMLLISADEISIFARELESIGGDGVLCIMAAALLVGMSSINAVSASALSIEGKYYWIIKSSPISVHTLMYAKLIPHLVVAAPATLISSILVCIALDASPFWWMIMILVPLVATVAFAMLGLVLNIAFPKFSFENEAQVVKQSLPVFILTFGGMVISAAFLFGALYASVMLGSLVAALILAVLVVVLFLVIYLIMTGPSAKRLERL